MITHLLVDSGNSRLKWVVGGATGWTPDALLVRDAQLSVQLDEAWADLPPPQSVAIVHVGSHERLQTISDWVARHWNCPVRVEQSQAELLDVRNSYHEPATLGVDRWVALIGARGLTMEAACVIDCGTAATVDALSADGDFLGGVIFPGLALLRESLACGTAGLRATGGNDAQCLARSTADAIAAGTLYGLVGAIERVVHEFETATDETMQLIITGGNADEVAARLARPARREPDLVLKGLARIVGIV